jgi:hypothetical protein
MSWYTLSLKNLLNPAILFFGLGVLFSLWRKGIKAPSWIGSFLSYILLLLIGVKGGACLAGNSVNTPLFYQITLVMVGWGLIQPVVVFFLLKKLTSIKPETAAAIAASFGSISLMTFITASFYLENFNVSYGPFMIAVLAIMEIPGIVSALFLVHLKKSIGSILYHAVFNKAILGMAIGGVIGYTVSHLEFTPLLASLQTTFPILLSTFLFVMGLSVGRYKHQLQNLGAQLTLFAISTAFFGGLIGLFLAWLLKTDIGTGAMMAVLSASASYIAVPATMKVALPEAEEAVYLPISLGVAFPFNILIGIPIYYQLASQVLR